MTYCDAINIKSGLYESGMFCSVQNWDLILVKSFQDEDMIFSLPKMNFDFELSFSEVTVVVFTIASVLISIWILITRIRRKHPLPPGPWSLPAIGNLLQLGEHPYISFDHMKKKYGDVFCLKLRMVPVVVVNGFDAVKQVLLRDGESFAGRPDMHTFSFFANGESMSFSVHYDEQWKLQKKIASKALKSLTKSEVKSSTCSCLLEEHVCAKASELVKTFVELSKKEGSFDPSAVTNSAMANVVCALCFGKEFLSIIKLNHDFQKACSVFNPADFIPCLRYLPLPNAKATREFYGNFNKFVAHCVKDHYAKYDEWFDKNSTDALLSVSNEKKPVGKAAALSSEKIINTVYDIFGADPVLATKSTSL
ncbi:LOW QUALITY PROTEIN: cytochrome P450 1A1-like [Heteronotia binoei]|uniref:LOW QUALITY PROTEIN: cytochrome P450 1A1-like n=1 Tax=Heteronotia binoei TaxID=13085 RepID=UPI00292E5B21|nr:LOW QUALITY PROTEIN: cytochrome P450 1A1-like [Heteronotia binoei]